VDARFGRCPYFLVVDSDSMAFEAIANPNASAAGGAGVQSAQLVAGYKVQAVLTGNCGPKAFQVFDAVSIPVHTGVSGSVHDAVAQFAQGAVKHSLAANVPRHFGVDGAGQS
jgi:predicted Fe-Mo cluster-binding NifX family protein